MVLVPEHCAASTWAVPLNSDAVKLPAEACANPLTKLLLNVIVKVELELKVLELATARLLSLLGGNPMMFALVVITLRPALDLLGITAKSQPM